MATLLGPIALPLSPPLCSGITRCHRNFQHDDRYVAITCGCASHNISFSFIILFSCSTSLPPLGYHQNCSVRQDVKMSHPSTMTKYAVQNAKNSPRPPYDSCHLPALARYLGIIKSTPNPRMAFSQNRRARYW